MNNNTCFVSDALTIHLTYPLTQFRECAQKIVNGLTTKLGDIMEDPEIAGPGFINIRFKEDYLSSAVGLMAKDANGRLGIPLTW